MLREMGLFGNYAPPGESPVSLPLKTLDQANYLIGMKKLDWY